MPSLPRLETLFEDLYKSEFERLCRRALRRIGNEADAQDVTQGTFVKFLRALQEGGSFDKNKLEHGIVSFLDRIHANNIIDFLRSRSLRYKVFVADENDFPDRRTPAAEECVLYGEMLVCAEAMVSRRARDLRLLQDLAYEQPIPEIAESMGVSISAAKSRINRLRERLRRKMGSDLESIGMSS